MQYLLTPNEYAALVEKKEYEHTVKMDELQNLCSLAAEHIPVKMPWNPEDSKPEPWGCVLSKNLPGYCDECPMQTLCPNTNKHFSK